ncbi:MAG: type II toxin-antitoxin system death-on-curing family toxin [Phycisphaerales bacterium]
MSTSRRFLSVEDVTQIHLDTLRHEGGLSGTRDHGLLESAVMMPRQQFDGSYLHRTLAEQAAAYLFHICANHPFNDGNKRAAVLASLVFLRVNGVTQLPDPSELEELTMKCAAGELTKAQVTTFFRKRTHKTTPRSGKKRGR